MKWNLKQKAPKQFLKKFDKLNPLLVQLLYNRGVKNKKGVEAFLQPDYEKHTHDPYLMKGMKKATSRIQKAFQNKEKIAIYGDYDADGVCACTILNKIFTQIGAKPEIYIPDREKEGYGLNDKGIALLCEKKIDLIITVDCGVSDWQEVKQAKKLGLDVIITDHHLIPSKLPEADVILNPHQKDCSYPYDYLSGAGVAFKLAQALISKFPDNFSKGYEKWLLDLVALATVADLMPLDGENRTLVKYGLVVLPQTKWLGLEALAQAAGIENLTPDLLSSRTLSFILGPRLNAAGRMDHANLAFELLNTDNPKEAQNIAENLETKNDKRRGLQQEIQDKLIKKLDKKEKIDFIFEGDTDWPVGIVGLIAGSICDHYYFPACIYSEGAKTTKGSCRSVRQINMVDTLAKCSKYIDEFGGHSQAAGFTVETEKLKQFEKCLKKVFKEESKKVKLIPEADIDAELEADKLSVKLEKTLDELAPFGKGNPEPLFLTRGWEVRSLRKVGNNGKHLKVTLKAPLERGFKYIDALYFSWSDTDRTEEFKTSQKYDIIFEPMIDVWRGEKKLTLKIVDFKEAKTES